MCMQNERPIQYSCITCERVITSNIVIQDHNNKNENMSNKSNDTLWPLVLFVHIQTILRVIDICIGALKK